MKNKTASTQPGLGVEVNKDSPYVLIGAELCSPFASMVRQGLDNFLEQINEDLLQKQECRFRDLIFWICGCGFIADVVCAMGRFNKSIVIQKTCIEIIQKTIRYWPPQTFDICCDDGLLPKTAYLISSLNSRYHHMWAVWCLCEVLRRKRNACLLFVRKYNGIEVLLGRCDGRIRFNNCSMILTTRYTMRAFNILLSSRLVDRELYEKSNWINLRLQKVTDTLVLIKSDSADVMSGLALLSKNFHQNQEADTDTCSEASNEIDVEHAYCEIGLREDVLWHLATNDQDKEHTYLRTAMMEMESEQDAQSLLKWLNHNK